MTCACGQDMEPIPDVGFVCLSHGPEFLFMIEVSLRRDGSIHVQQPNLPSHVVVEVLDKAAAVARAAHMYITQTRAKAAAARWN